MILWSRRAMPDVLFFVPGMQVQRKIASHMFSRKLLDFGLAVACQNVTRMLECFAKAAENNQVYSVPLTCFLLRFDSGANRKTVQPSLYAHYDCLLCVSCGFPQQAIDAKSCFYRFTMDTFTTMAFGEDLHSLNASKVCLSVAW